MVQTILTMPAWYSKSGYLPKSPLRGTPQPTRNKTEVKLGNADDRRKLLSASFMGTLDWNSVYPPGAKASVNNFL